MNVLILASGGSEVFEKAGYSYPKNLVEIDGIPLIQHIINNVSMSETKVHVVLRKDEITRFHTDSVIQLLAPGAKIIQSPVPTSGAACAALLAVEFINNDDPLMIVNGDQLLMVDHKAMIQDFVKRDLDGGIPVFEDVHPRYSFVRLDEKKLVVEAAEKRPISKMATAGRYYFRRGSMFIQSAEKMILKDAHTEGVFYVCPSYNEAILAGARIGVYPVLRSQYINLNTPQAVQEYSGNATRR